MKRDKMYPERVGNISAFRGCSYSCSYCAFRGTLRRSPCEKCRTFEPHAHLEALNRNPPRTKESEFLTIGLTGDLSFASDTTMQAIIHYCQVWSDHTFMIQSKNPAFFLEYKFPENVILDTTIETNREHIWGINDPLEIRYDYQDISGAPLPENRYEAMLKLGLGQRKAITVEPVLDFDLEILAQWIINMNPKIVWIGYDNHNHKLPEPPMSKTEALIERLKEATSNESKVVEKTIRKAWWEK